MGQCPLHDPDQVGLGDGLHIEWGFPGGRESMLASVSEEGCFGSRREDGLGCDGFLHHKVFRAMTGVHDRVPENHDFGFRILRRTPPLRLKPSPSR